VPRVQKRKKLGEESIHKAKDNRRYRSQLFLRVDRIAEHRFSLCLFAMHESAGRWCSVPFSRTGPTDLLSVQMGEWEGVSGSDGEMLADVINAFCIA
jgi:hypothetical protein